MVEVLFLLTSISSVWECPIILFVLLKYFNYKSQIPNIPKETKENWAMIHDNIFSWSNNVLSSSKLLYIENQLLSTTTYWSQRVANLNLLYHSISIVKEKYQLVSSSPYSIFYFQPLSPWHCISPPQLMPHAHSCLSSTLY